MGDKKGDGRVPTLTDIFKEPTINRLGKKEGLPENYDDIPNMNVYDAGEKRGDWQQYLKDKNQTWLITPLHRSSGPKSRYIRKAAGGVGRWDDRTTALKKKKNVDASWVERRYILKTNEGTGLPRYTMFEYSPVENKPTQYALCRIIKKLEGKEIDRTDSDNGDKGETSQSQESMQQGYYNQQVLEAKLRELIELGFSEEHILEAFRRIKSEKIPPATSKHEPGPSTSNWRTTEPENMDLMKNMDWINDMDMSFFEGTLDFIKQ